MSHVADEEELQFRERDRPSLRQRQRGHHPSALHLRLPRGDAAGARPRPRPPHTPPEEVATI